LNAVGEAFGTPTFDHFYLGMFLIVCQEEIKLNLKILLQRRDTHGKAQAMALKTRLKRGFS
jgi:hypothetical protein